MLSTSRIILFMALVGERILAVDDSKLKAARSERGSAVDDSTGHEKDRTRNRAISDVDNVSSGVDLGVQMSAFNRLAFVAFFIGLAVAFYLRPAFTKSTDLEARDVVAPEYPSGGFVSQIVFTAIALVILLAPPIAYFTQRPVLLLLKEGWGMFSEPHWDAEQTRITYAGSLTWGLGLLSLLILVSRQEFHTSKPLHSQRNSLAVLAIIRILLPMTFLFSGWSEFFFFDWHHQALAILVVIQGIACLMLCLGVQAQLASLILFAFCVASMDSPSSYRCHHAHFRTLMFGILAFTPCNAVFSLKVKATTRSIFDGTWHDDALWPWATALFRFHLGIVYFAAGIDKLRHNWLSGEVLCHVLTNYQQDQLSSFRTWLLTKDQQDHAAFLHVCAILTCACVALELALPFVFWTRWNLHAVAIGFMMHAGMSLFLGNLGGYTQLAWLALLGCTDSDWVADVLQNNIRVALATMLLLNLMFLNHMYL